jgi:hypothetical protein
MNFRKKNGESNWFACRAKCTTDRVDMLAVPPPPVTFFRVSIFIFIWFWFSLAGLSKTLPTPPFIFYLFSVSVSPPPPHHFMNLYLPFVNLIFVLLASQSGCLHPHGGAQRGACSQVNANLILGCGSAFISSGSGSSILGWTPIRIRNPELIRIQGFNDRKF